MFYEILFYNIHFLQFQFTPLSSPVQSTPVNQPHDTPGKLLCMITQKTVAYETKIQPGTHVLLHATRNSTR